MTATLRPGPNVIDVIGPTFHNKGDQLMLAALRTTFQPSFRVRCLDGSSSRSARRLLIAPTRKIPLLGGTLRAAYYGAAALLPDGVCARLNLAARGDIAATFDCSGYFYGDPWQHVVRKSHWRLGHYRRVKDAGRPVVFMPQAFGPFSNPDVAAFVHGLLSVADLVACRDHQSLQHVQDLGLDGPIVRFVPDITTLAPAILPTEPTAWADSVAVVPNLRMVDKTREAEASAYISFQADLIGRIRKRGLRPVLVLHETFDREIAQLIRAASGGPVDIIDVDPLRTKGLIKSCKALISSRFHALVSSLSQATPCLGTSWTHKYRELFSDYGMLDALLPIDASSDVIDAKLDQILEEPSRCRVVETLREHAAWHASEVHGFFATVANLIPSAMPHAPSVPASLSAPKV